MLLLEDVKLEWGAALNQRISILWMPWDAGIWLQHPTPRPSLIDPGCPIVSTICTITFSCFWNKNALATMCLTQSLWCARLTSSWRQFFCFNVQSFRWTSSAPGCHEFSSWCVWVGNWGRLSRLKGRTPDIYANHGSSHGYLRGLVLICKL